MEKIILHLPIYTHDIDYSGHVNNLVYIQWTEICRTQFFEQIGLPLPSLKKQGFFPVLVETQMVYRQPVYFGDRVRAEMWLSELTKLYCWMEFRFFNGEDKLAATGRQKGVFINTETIRPIRLTSDHHQQFQRFLQIESGRAGVSANAIS